MRALSILFTAFFPFWLLGSCTNDKSSDKDVTPLDAPAHEDSLRTEVGAPSDALAAHDVGLEEVTTDLAPAAKDVPPDIPFGPCESYPIAPDCFDIAKPDEADCAWDYPEPTAFHDKVDQMFAQAQADNPGFSVDRLTFPVYDFTPENGPQGRLSWEQTARHEYFALPGYLQGFAQQLALDYSAAHLITFLSEKADNCSEISKVQGLLEQCTARFMRPDGLQPALELLWASANDASLPPSLLADWLPPAQHAPIARFVCALAVANLLVDDAFAMATAEILLDEQLYQMASFGRTFANMDSPDGLAAFGALTDFPQLYRGLALVMLASESLAEDLAGAQFSGKKLLVTPLGVLAIAGSDDHIHGDVPSGYLAIVDLGGNDSYLSAAAATRLGVPVSVVVDIDGHDSYDNSFGHSTAFAAGHLGVAVLHDQAGDDQYSSDHNSISAACLGAAALIDVAGDDSYSSVTYSQSAALLGVTLLADLGGDDTYYSFYGSQAYASYQGASLLLDKEGNDNYIAERDLVIYPAAQNKNVNASMSQGAAHGFRNDEAGLPNTFPGGVAMLADLSGDDVYDASIFAGGVGYWFGLGVQLDLDGSDSYQGVWYNQGSSAHFAAGLHADYGDGNDSYFCAQDQCIGEGRDYSVAVCINEAGNDQYHGKGARNIGAGDLFGIGMFWDQDGDDSYQVDSHTGVGAAFSDTDNPNSITFGLFLDDGAGSDTYQHDGQCADSAFWSQLGNHNDGQWSNVLAMGLDQ